MKTILIIALVGCLFVASARADNVQELGPDDFDQVVDGSAHTLVEFYAPWCGHCKRLAPEYEAAAEMFKGNSDVKIVKVDADKNRDLGGRFDVKGFPTLKWFPKGSTTPENYDGGRTTDEIVEWVNKRAGTNVRVKKAPSAVNFLSAANFQSTVHDENKDVLVEFFAPWCGHCKRLAPDYAKVAGSFAGEEDVVVAAIDCDANKDICSANGVSGYPTIKFFPRGSSSKSAEDYNGDRSPQAFVDFLNDKAGTERTVGGGLKETAGRTEALDKLAKEFLSADSFDSIIANAEAEVAKLTGRAAKIADYYVKAMKKGVEKGKDFFKTEAQRLARMIEAGNVAPNKLGEFQYRANILKAFSSE